MRPALANIATLLRANLPATVKTVLLGRDDEPKMDDLPQVQIFPESTAVQLSGTLRDEQTKVVNIRVIASSKQYLSQTQSNLRTVSSMLAVCDFMEKKEASGAFSTTSILGIFRNNPDINDEVLYQNNVNVNYSSLDELGFPNVVGNLTIELRSRNLTT